MIKSWPTSLLMLFVVLPAWGLNEARLLKQSTSGQTALFNLGSMDGVKEGDYAVVVKQIRTLDSRDLRIIPVARARNVKINLDSSVWILYKVFDPELMVEGQAFLILSESELLRGRRDIRYGRLQVVGPQGKASTTAKNTLNGDNQEIKKLGHKYEATTKLHEKEHLAKTDGELIDLEDWEKLKGEKYHVALYKSPDQAEFRRRMRLATFEKLVTGYLRKINDPDFNYDAFYDEQMKTEYSNEFRKNSIFETEYRKYMANESEKTANNAKLQRQLLEKGEAWSEDFSDEELAGALNNVSILQEKSRRDYIISKPSRYYAGVDYGMNLNDGQTGKDSYRREKGSAIEAGIEVTPFLKHETLERFTLFTSLRKGQTAFDAGNNNAGIDDLSVSLGANWYPLYAPHALESPVIYLGTFIRSGYANVAAPTVSEEANYTLLSVPAFQAGMKYTFKNHFGLRIVTSMETLNLERYEASKIASVLPDQVKLVEGKLGFGIGYSF